MSKESNNPAPKKLTEKQLAASNVRVAVAQRIVHKAAAIRVDKRLVAARRTEMIPCVCGVTGITIYLDIPSIPVPDRITHPAGFTAAKNIMEMISPLADYKNCRGLAGAGAKYLAQLDTAILSAILIVLTDNYDLIRYSAVCSGVQKNAIYRMAGKDTLVNAVNFIETWVNTGNAERLPRLSMVLDSDVTDKEITIRITEWLKLCHENLVSPADYETEEDFYAKKPPKTVFASVATVHNDLQKKLRKAKEASKKKADWAAQNAQWKVQRELKEDLATAKKITKQLAADNLIGNAAKRILTSVFSGDNLSTMDAFTKNALVAKMEKLKESTGRDQLIAIIKKDLSPITEDDLFFMDEAESEVESEPADEPEQAAPTAPANEAANEAVDSVEVGDSIVSIIDETCEAGPLPLMASTPEPAAPADSIVAARTPAPQAKESLAQKLARIKAERLAREAVATNNQGAA